ncbi:hypothetical protein ACHAXR_009275 [Thalassiosira sp. AJA248-18]
MNLRWSGAAAAIMAAAAAPSSYALVAKSHSPLLATKPTTRTSLFMGPPSDPSAPLTDQYGEGSRKYRRTVYTHDQWVKHRSSDRFVNNLRSLPSSGIYKQISKEVFLTVSIAVSVCVWNALVGGYEDFAGVMHDPVIQESWAQKVGMPMEAFTLLSPSLGLLLVFRTNSSYNRWDEARKFWGLNINHTRDLNRMAAAWYGNQSNWDSTAFMGAPTTKQEPIDPIERQYLLGQVSLMTWAFVRSMKRHLSPPDEDEEDYLTEIKSRLTPEQADALISATHRPNRALYDLSVAIEKLPMHFVRKNSINQNLSIFEDTLGGCERLLSSPVPLFYSRHTARFLATWLLALPFGLYAPFANSWNHWVMIPATAFISVCLFGIEELATQLEEPFTILPMQGFCDKIGANCDEIVSWAGQGQEDEAVEAATRTNGVTPEDEIEKVRPEEEMKKTASRLGRIKNRIRRRLSLRERLSQVGVEAQKTPHS